MTAQNAAKLSLTVTCIVVAAKLVAGIISQSISVLAEALQSMADVFIAAGVVFTIKVAARPPDDDHPYGHGKAEVVMSAVQMLVLVATAGYIIARAVDRLQHPEPITPDLGMIVMAGAAVVNWVVSGILLKTAKKTESKALHGEVMHLRADAIAAGGVFGGLLLVKTTGWQAFDPIVAILFALIIALSSLKRFRELLHPLMDGAIDPEELVRVEKAITEHPHVRGYHNLRTRQVGSVRVVEFHVLLEDDLTFVQAHEQAESIEDAVRKELGGALVNVHYEPYAAEIEHQRKVHGHKI